MKFNIGADPEVFLRKDGVMVSADGIIKGSKERPYPMGDGYESLRDNLMVEFNTPPQTTLAGWVKSIEVALAKIQDQIGNEYELVSAPSATFKMKDIMSDAGQEAGCSEWLDAYTRESVTITPSEMQDVRFAGGHIHFGWENPNDTQRFAIVKELDKILYPLSDKDPCEVRKQYYGRKGQVRSKPYGIEYRSLSNFWVGDKRLTSEIYNRVESVMSRF